MTTAERADFVPVKVEEALVEPEGFYSALNAVDVAHRRLVLIRLPNDVCSKVGILV